MNVSRWISDDVFIYRYISFEQAQDFKERIVPDDVFKEKMVSKFQ